MGKNNCWYGNYYYVFYFVTILEKRPLSFSHGSSGVVYRALHYRVHVSVVWITVFCGRPAFSCSLQIRYEITLQYASPYLSNQLPSSFRQPHSVHCPPGSPHPVHITSSQSSPSLSPSVTSSVFHSRLFFLYSIVCWLPFMDWTSCFVDCFVVVYIWYFPVMCQQANRCLTLPLCSLLEYPR